MYCNHYDNWCEEEKRTCNNCYYERGDNMNDEEKKAMIELNHFSNMTAYWKQEEYTNSEIDNYIKLILNLIKNQQKELEELKDIQQQICNEELIEEKYVKENYVAKDKIKAKIEELDKEYVKYKGNKGLEFSRTGLINSQIQCLQSLLEKE